MKKQEEKKTYNKFYNTVIIITGIIIVFLMISIPKTANVVLKTNIEKDILYNEKQEGIPDIHYVKEYKTENETVLPKLKNRINEESEVYVVIEKVDEIGNNKFYIDENLEYHNLILRVGKDTTGYNIIYVSDDGKVIRAEEIKGIVWDLKEIAVPASEKSAPKK